DAVLLIERDARYLIKADDIVLTDKAALPIGVVHKHAGNGRLAARHEVGVRRDLLKEMTLTGPTRAELDDVVIVLDERDHPKQHYIPHPGRQRRRLQAHASN